MTRSSRQEPLLKMLFARTETFVALVIVALCLVIGAKSPAFFSVGNLFDLLRSSVEMGVMALGFFVVLISGGIDVSFAAIAVLSLYGTSKLLTAMNFQGSVIWAFLIAALIGLILGLFNATFISYFRMNTLIVTLGTASIFRGIMLVFVGTRIITSLPKGMLAFGRANLIQIQTAGGRTVGLSASVLLLAGAAVLVWAVLRYTTLGRGIFALGGDAVSARRAGFNVAAIQLFVYGLAGALSGVTGIVHASAVRNANPFDLIGTELGVIAAVVLGGARITGGLGSVTGTLLGVLLVVIMNNSLILLGVPSFWQRAVVGLLIILGTGITAYQSRRESSVNLLES